MYAINTKYRTNFFDFGDKTLIENVSKECEVQATTNGAKVALVGNDLEKIVAAIKKSFNNNVKFKVKDDIVYVNM
jgi:hypothetical protein